MKVKILFSTLLFGLFTHQAVPADDVHKDFFTEAFESPQQVTLACLECHEDAASEVMATVHWTWETILPDAGSQPEVEGIGKKNVFNNFCIAVESNWPRCTSCHAGYGWKDATFDFTAEENVDCLVCHDQTGTYKKSPAGAGMPAKEVDLLLVAQNVGAPTRANCGSCHFYGGGGENVKHGDLDPGLVNPSAEYDVHMGNGMTCQDCHTTESHQIRGRSMAIITDEQSRVECVDCHKTPVHDNKLLNNHSSTVACQTCHIPVFAKDRPTKIYWDWSTAGTDTTLPEDQYGMPTYDKKKGTFVWGQHLEPEYYWYNGKSDRYLKGEKIDPEEILALNTPLGAREDKNARIYPFKVMRGKQIYDSNYYYLIIPQLWGGYWKHFDWNKAAKEGMETAGLPYSENYGWVKTEMYWKLNHMVSPKEKALKCMDCHGKGNDKRLDWKRLDYDGDPQNKD